MNGKGGAVRKRSDRESRVPTRGERRRPGRSDLRERQAVWRGCCWAEWRERGGQGASSAVMR